MELNKIVALLFLLCISKTFSHGVIKRFDFCGGLHKSIFSVSSIRISPYPIRRGQDTKIVVNFDSSEVVHGGEICGSIYYGFNSLIKYDRCSELQLPSPGGPLQKGMHKIEVQKRLPEYVPAGSYRVRLEGTSDEGKKLFCAYMTVDVE